MHGSPASADEHALGVRSTGIEKTSGRAETSSLHADLAPGVDELFCTVRGHELAGMTAQLPVR